MTIDGLITTSGNGPLGGPGAPKLSEEMGEGGSYGGSGGRGLHLQDNVLNCSNTYYSNSIYQVNPVNCGCYTCHILSSINYNLCCFI